MICRERGKFPRRLRADTVVKGLNYHIISDGESVQPGVVDGSLTATTDQPFPG
jgi:hypothetical protein